jgi:hypothetical protein
MSDGRTCHSKLMSKMGGAGGMGEPCQVWERTPVAGDDDDDDMPDPRNTDLEMNSPAGDAVMWRKKRHLGHIF